jgi:hypothetical protein
MFKGELIFKDADPVYSRTFFRPYDAIGVTFVVDLMQMVGSFSGLDITVQHRERDEDSWTDAGIFTLPDPLLPGMYTRIVSPVKALVRLKFVQGGGDWMRLLIYLPVWS